MTMYPRVISLLLLLQWCLFGYSSHSPTSAPSYEYSPAPDILSVSASATKSSIDVTVILSKAGAAFCAVYTGGTLPLSTAAIVLQQHFAFVTTDSESALITISELQSATMYDVYCVSRSNFGEVSSYVEALATRQAVITTCCKEILVSLAGTSFPENTDVANMFTFSVDGAPSGFVSVDLVINRINALNGLPTVVSGVIHPAGSVIFNDKTWQTKQIVSLVGTTAATYSVSAVITGGSAMGSYDVVFENNISTFVLQPSDTVPPTPKILTAVFSSDGSTIIVSFDSATDKANRNSVFACNLLFTFNGSDTSTCQWTTSSSLIITLGGSFRVGVKGNLAIKASTLRASCSLSTSVCSTWPTLTPADNSVIVAAPPSPVSPTVAISAPAQAGPCDAPIIDVSASSGSGGRAWASVKITVKSQVDVTALQQFFDTTYKVSPPTAIPRNLLVAGNTYEFQVKMCNFLGGCTSNTHQLTATESRVPVVSIVGQQVRSVGRDSSFLLQGQGYVAECDGSKTYSGLTYTWKVLTNSVEDPTIKSVSSDTTKFRLLPYTLSSRYLYEISLTVTSRASSLSGTAVVQVQVPRLNIVAIIAGGVGQCVRRGDSLILDGSGSYDADLANRADKSGLTFSWSCSQFKPKLSASCGLGLTASGSEVTLDTNALPEVGSVYAIALAVSDSTRETVETVYVTIAEETAPVVTLTQRNGVRKINPSSELVLRASVTQTIPASAVWSVDDSSVVLNTVSKTAVSRTLPSGSNDMFLVLSANSLLGKTLPYVFSLKVGSVTSSLAVVVNTAPAPGIFTVYPNNGTAMTTRFLFSADKWSDDDVPISYEFGYLAASVSTTNVVRGRAENTFGFTTLAAGDSSSGHNLICQVRVFDSLSAVTSAQSNVVVRKLVLTSLELKDKVANQFTAGEGNINNQKEIISVTSSVMNTVDCSSAPDCTSLKRESCSTTLNTCGACLTGYYGSDGHSNSACVDNAMLAQNSGVTTCSSDAECLSWQYCNAGQCSRLSKTCSNQCSGVGTCMMVLADSGKAVDKCLMGDTSCQAVCSCNAGFGGSMCQVSEGDIGTKQTLREQLLDHLHSLTAFDDPTADSVASWQSALKAITMAPDELSIGGSEVALSIVEKILSSASDLSLSYDTLKDILGTIDAASLGSSREGGSNRIRRRLSTLTETISLLDTFATYMAQDMVQGQNAENSVNSMFRMTTQVLSKGGTISVPQTSYETASQVATSSCSIDADSEQKVSVMSIKAKLYEDKLNSNALRVRFVDSSVDGRAPTITVVLQNSVEQEYNELIGYMYFNTTCERGDFSEHYHSCPGPVGDVTVSHKCNGTATYMESLCPNVTAIPGCKVLGSDAFKCEVQSHDSKSTTCLCTFNGGGRRSLGALDKSGALEVAAVSEMVATEFATTISTADDFNSIADLKKTLTVILMYVVLWAGGLLGVFICSMRQTVKTMKSDAVAAELQLKKDVAGSTRSREAIRSYLTAYVNEIFPSVFQSTAGTHRLWNEISKHHRYLLLFTAQGKNAETVRMLTCVHLLTIQSMLMFILAVCYDLNCPNDDGTCATYDTKADCLHEKSVFDQSASVCEWKSDSESGYSCNYVNAEISIQSIVIISIVVAVFTAPINLLVDFLFIEVLSAPSADKLKEQDASSAVKRAMRRVSNVGRRISAVSIETVGALRSSVFGLRRKSSSSNFDMDTTRVVPDSAAEAQILAATSASNLLDNAKQSINARLSLRKSQRIVTRVQQVKAQQEARQQRKYRASSFMSSAIVESSSRDNDETGSDQMEGGQVNEEVHALSSNPLYADKKLRERFAELCVDISEQRKLLKRAQQDSFDTMWGVDPTGEFSQQRQMTFYFDTQKSAEELIMQEMKYVKSEVASKYNKLRYATDVQTGVEILHLFILDLLGRDTPVAKIFLTKSEEDFRHSMVISDAVKAVAWVVVVLLNLFFVYFSMLRGLQRGQRWQNLYLMACLLQFFIEVVFYETSECAIVHYYIPNLARREVQSVSFTLHQAVQKICGSVKEDVSVVLDAPRYLFISTNLAMRFPDLLESVIVQSYHTYSPGELSRKWAISHGSSYALAMNPWARSNSRVRRFTLYAVFISLMQQLGATSPTLQRVLIHLIQPFVVSAFFLVLVVFRDRPYYSFIFGPPIMYVFYRLYDDYRRENLDKKDSEVHPDKYEPSDGDVALTGLKHVSSEDYDDIGLPRQSSYSSSKDSRHSSLQPCGDDVGELPVLPSKQQPVSKLSGVLSSDDECKDADVDSSDVEVGGVHADSDTSVDVVVITKKNHISPPQSYPTTSPAPTAEAISALHSEPVSDVLMDMTSEDDVRFVPRNDESTAESDSNTSFHRTIGNISDTDSSIDMIGRVRVIPLSTLCESEDTEVEDVRPAKSV